MPLHKTHFSKFSLLAPALFAATLQSAAGASPVLPFKVEEKLPHDSRIFTQGLESRGPWLFESGGNYNQSSLSVLRITDLKPQRQIALPADVFAEGITLVGDELLLLSWRGERLFRFSLPNLNPLPEQTYSGEGWGLAFDGSWLWRSDGSSRIFRHDPATFAERGDILVRDGGFAQKHLNELEFISASSGTGPLLLANVWQRDHILAICPLDGQVLARLELGEIARRHRAQGVLNGIAQVSNGLLVTGKNWDALYRLQVDFTPIAGHCTPTPFGLTPPAVDDYFFPAP